MNNGLIIFCLPGNDFSKDFFINWIQFMTFLKKNKIDFMISIEGGSNVSVVRERCLGLEEWEVVMPNQIPPFHGKIDYTHIMWIDSDVFFKPEDFMKLLERDKDIVAGLYLKDPKHYAATKVSEKTAYGDLESMTKADLIGPDEKPIEDLIEGVGVGMGFMLVKKGVFESVQRPWFLTTPWNFSGILKLLVSEDIYFCLKAREAGFKLWLDPTVLVKHLKLVPLS